MTVEPRTAARGGTTRRTAGAAGTAGVRTVLLLSTADFWSSVWTNKQHVARIIGQDRAVVYVESLGLREPRLTAADAVRIARRLRRLWRMRPLAVSPRAGSARQRDVGPRPLPDGVRLLSPAVLPWHRYAPVRALNRRLLHRSVAGLGLDPHHTLLWTFSPVTYGLEQFARAGVVYHAVDLLHEIDGLPAPLLRAAEARLVPVADAVLASSAPIRDHLRTFGRLDVQLWQNVADVTLYASAPTIQREPRVLFAGNLTGAKVDFPLVAELVRAGALVDLAGPIGIDGGSAQREVAELAALPGPGRARYLGNLAPADLAAAAARCTVGIIPYLDNPYTRGVFPMKVYEYLAAGLAVVSTRLPGLAGEAGGHLHVVDRDGFAGAVLRVLAVPSSADVAARRAQAGPHSWESRARQIRRLLDRPAGVAGSDPVREGRRGIG
ncbi:MAG TPA: glycosyltransferase [Kineosporiaceae bacterium]